MIESLSMFVSGEWIPPLFLGMPIWVIVAVTFVLMVLNSSIMVPSSQYVCVLAGIALGVNNGPLSPIIAATLAGIGNLLGTTLWYWAGRNAHSQLALRARQWAVMHVFFEHALPVAQAQIARRGVYGLFLLRFIPVVRSIASLPAGAAQIGWRPFLVSTTLGMCTWSFFWLFLGYVMGHRAPAFIIPILGIVVPISGLAFYMIRPAQGIRDATGP